MSLEEIRGRIDTIDAEIVRLLDERAEAGRRAAELKIAANLPLRNPERENIVVTHTAARSNGSMPRKSLERIYRTIIEETLAQEYVPAATECSSPLTGKRDMQAELVENSQVAPGYHRMRLRLSEPVTFEPGQFFQLKLPAGSHGVFLRRPFAPSYSDGNELTFVYAVVGRGTSLLAHLAVGSIVKILAPLGNAYTLPETGSSALLIGGGCGGPSLAPLARSLKALGVRTTVLIGARTSTFLLEHETFAAIADRLVLATDDGSKGCHGTALDAFRTEHIDRPDRIYACGPTPMLRAVNDLASTLSVECQVSLEERMACGFGACMGCAVPVKTPDGGNVYRRVCHEGPVFDARILDWPSM